MSKEVGLQPPMRTFTNHSIAFGPFVLDTDNRLLFREGQTAMLPPKAMDTLMILIEHRGQTMDKEQLMSLLWPDAFVEEGNLAVNISTLRKILGESPEGGQYIETVPRRGYRFVGEVTDTWDETANRKTKTHELDTGPSPVSDSDGIETPKSSIQNVEAPNYYRVIAILGSAGLLLVAGLVYAIWFRPPGPSDLSPVRRLAVLPFRNQKPDSETDFLGFSLTDSIITRLGYVNSLVVRPSSYVEKYRDQEVDPQRAAEDLKVDALLVGSYVKDGDDLRITAQLIEVKTGARVWGETLDVKYDKLLTLQDHVTQEIIKGLNLNLTSAEAQHLRQDMPDNAEAYEYYLRGLSQLSTSNHRKAIADLEHSVAVGPRYGLAWAYLGKAYTIAALQYFGGRTDYVKAEAAFKQALAVGPDQPAVKILCANFYTETGRPEQAVPLLREVIATNPNTAYARWELSYTYRYAGMLDESIAEGERSLQIEPDVTAHLFNSYFYAGKYRQFIDSLPAQEKAYINFYRGLGYYYLKDTTAASAAFDRALVLDPDAITSQIGKALRLSIAGNNREGIEILRSTEAKIENEGLGDGEISYKLAQAYAVLGDKLAALNALRQSIGQGFFCYPYFIADPLLENIRGESAYNAVIEYARVRHEEFKRRFFSS